MMTGTTCFFPTYPTMPHISKIRSEDVLLDSTRPTLDSQWLSMIGSARRWFSFDPATGLRPSIRHFLRAGPAPASLFLQPVTELFDDRVGQDLARNALHLCLGGGLVQASVKRDLKELALAHV